MDIALTRPSKLRLLAVPLVTGTKRADQSSAEKSILYGGVLLTHITVLIHLGDPSTGQE